MKLSFPYVLSEKRDRDGSPGPSAVCMQKKENKLKQSN